MLRRIRSFVLIVIAAIAGAVCGRAFAQMRERSEQPFAEDASPGNGLWAGGLRLRPQDIVPGIVAAFRVSEAPWSWLHIPGWLAAFVVNFAAAALSGDLRRLRDLFEAGGITLGDPWQDERAADVNGDAPGAWDAGEGPTTT